MAGQRALSCVHLLSRSLNLAGGCRHLVVLDEHADVRDYSAFLETSGTCFVTNRYDVFQQFKRRTERVEFSDFDFTECARGSVDAVFFRISKEKAVVHHVINCAFRILAPGGTLHLCGFRNEGIKTYIRKAADLFAGGKRVKTTGSGARYGVMTRRGQTGDPDLLPDEDYPKLRAVEIAPGFRMYTKPGIFGWRGEDPGSALLVSAVEFPEGVSVLDLGCGYGYLSIEAFRRGAGSVWATDNNAAAVAACRRNFAEWGIPGRVTAGDRADTVTGEFDMILCNPPFHQGFRTRSDLAGQFLEAVSRLLVPSGKAFIVVNCFIPLEKIARPLFGEVITLTESSGFKVLRVGSPCV